MSSVDSSIFANVSVIIPAWNASSTIARTINSVLKQSVLPREVIVVDDASADFDELKSVVSRIDFPEQVSFKLIRNEVNLNGAATRNKGIVAASCPVIAFLDSDDEWEREKLELCVKEIEGSESSKIIYTQAKIVNNGVVYSIRPARGIKKSEHMSEYLFLSGGFIQTSTIVCSKEIALKTLFNPDFRRHQDYDFCLRAAGSGVEFHFIEAPLVRYNANPGLFGKRSEDPEYTRSWGKAMRAWMSYHGYHGFNLFLTSGRLAARRHYGAAFLNGIKHGILLGPIGLWKAKSKVLSLCRALLRR